jgi:hypothetical protein
LLSCPHTHTSPLDFSATEWLAPAAMATTFVRDDWTGTFRSVGAPLSPTCPLVFRPHTYSAPLLVSAIEWLSPAATPTTPVNPLTGTGDLRAVVLLSPS